MSSDVINAIVAVGVLDALDVLDGIDVRDVIDVIDVTERGTTSRPRAFWTVTMIPPLAKAGIICVP
jgi:hypothetical protein